MERIGVRYFQRLSEKYPHNFSPDEIHVLNPQERQELRRIQRNNILRAGLAGAISAGLGVLAGVLLEKPMLGPSPSDVPFDEQFGYLAAVMGISTLITLIEIAFLYLDALRSVHRLSVTAGLDLFPDNEGDAVIATVLVRAALELPNPPDGKKGINPRREISKVQLLIGTLVYKLKATATNFIVKALVRRVVGRAGFRTWMEVTAMPVFAFWNGLIAWWVMKQARIRAMGPSAVKEYTEVIFREMGEVGHRAREESFQAVGSAIVRSVDLHPNLISLIEALEGRFGSPEELVLDDSALFLEHLSELKANEQEFVLRILAMASIIDGKLKRRERQLLREALAICGFPPELDRINRWRKAFVKGDELPEYLIVNCLPERLTGPQPSPAQPRKRTI
ncbi:MAG: hypothetical protein AAGN35_21270 [Bacteroidota bacterium]